MTYYTPTEVLVALGIIEPATGTAAFLLDATDIVLSNPPYAEAEDAPQS